MRRQNKLAVKGVMTRWGNFLLNFAVAALWLLRRAGQRVFGGRGKERRAEKRYLPPRETKDLPIR